MAEITQSLPPTHYGGFPVMAEMTCLLATNTGRQSFFVITTTASIRSLVENFQPNVFLCGLQINQLKN